MPNLLKQMRKCHRGEEKKSLRAPAWNFLHCASNFSSKSNSCDWNFSQFFKSSAMQNFNWFNFFLLLLLPLSEKNVDFLFNFIKFFKLSFSLMDANGKIKTIFTNSFPRIFYRERERVGYSEKEGKNDRIINNNKVWQISKVQKHGKFKSEVSEKILKRIKGQQKGGGMLNWERFITINLSPHGKAD